MSSATKSSTAKEAQVPRKELTADLVRVSKTFPAVTLSRNFYRAHGKYSENAWQKHFSRFSDFLAAAGLSPKPTTSSPVVKTAPKADETNEVVGDQWTITMPKTRISSLEQLLVHAKVDLSVWEVERFIINKWEVGIAVGEGSKKYVETEPLYQVKATLRKRTEMVAIQKEIALLKDEAKKSARVPKPIARSNKRSGNMLEISLSDAHFGKLAWSRETGGPDYDTRIAQKEFLVALEHLIDRSSGYTFDSVLFVVGNDLIHSDDLQGRTTKGTVVDCDTRYYKTFEIVRETVTIAVERLRRLAPVIVKMVPGNHDSLSVWHLGDSLSAIFAKYEDVVIDNEPTYRKYHQWGKCGLLLTHGDKGKRADFPLLFATERPDIFGSTQFREVHTGHWHQTRTEEFHGVRVRIIPSLSAADAWHSENGFIGQQRVAEAYVFNSDEGLIAQFYHNADA